MARKTMWAVAGALLAFAPFASAATYDLQVENARFYASELITGADIEIDYDGATPTLTTSINFGADAGGEVLAIDQGDVLEVTITLHNAKFGENVRGGDLKLTRLAAAGIQAGGFSGNIGGCSARVKDTEGGEQGSSTVTFQVEAADGNCSLNAANQPNFIVMPFELPTLEGLSTRGRAVTASVTTAAGGGSGWIDTEDSARVGTPSNMVCSDDSSMARTTCVKIDENGVLARLGPAAANRGQTHAPLVSFASGLTFTPASGGSAEIDLAGGRTSFVRNRPGQLGSVRVGVTTAAACTTDDPIPAGCIRQTDGREFSIGRGGEGQGDLMVSVTGDFREGDTVWLEHDGVTTGASASEMLDLQDDGSMTGTFALDDIAGNAAAAAGDTGDMDREEGVTTRALLYMPNGEDGLRPATFRSRFMVDFDSDDVRNKDWAPASNTGANFTTSFTVVEDTQHAYAIPELGANDEGNVRIKCEVATECTVYLECDDTAGTSRFAQLDDPIGGRATRTLNPDALADALNFGDDGWEGSLSCTVYSTREISVQVLVRSADTLVNQTYIEND